MGPENSESIHRITRGVPPGEKSAVEFRPHSTELDGPRSNESNTWPEHCLRLDSEETSRNTPRDQVYSVEARSMGTTF